MQRMNIELHFEDRSLIYSLILSLLHTDAHLLDTHTQTNTSAGA